MRFLVKNSILWMIEDVRSKALEELWHKNNGT